MPFALGLAEVSFTRLAIIVAVAIGAHLAVMLVRASSQWLISTALGSISKAQTLTRFLASTAVFIIWFIAFGITLYELGVPLQTYIASATIIGLAVSFGSQSLVQDVIAGLTLILGGLIDVGDMVDIGGQTGIVEKIGIRFTELRNAQGAVISIPNRNVSNIISYRVGYIRTFVDVRLPRDEAAQKQAAEQLERIAHAAYHQFAGIMIRQPTIVRITEKPDGSRLSAFGSRQESPRDQPESPKALAESRQPTADSHYRIKFRIWPGQNSVIESAVRQRIIQTMRTLDPSYQDWMVAIHYRVEPAFKRKAVSALDAFRKRRQKSSST